MCGLICVVGDGTLDAEMTAATLRLRHRGPDGYGIWVSPQGGCSLGHRRLSIIDLSAAGQQPMCDATERYWLVFNGEIYNYVELREHLAGEYPFRTRTDTEVLLAAYQKWGMACLDHLLGMFAFALWDEERQTLFAASDRFGVKPLYYAALPSGQLAIASEIKALHALGVPRRADPATWATYLSYGLYEHSERTFWQDASSLPAGHALAWQADHLQTWCWYDLAERVGESMDERSEAIVMEEYRGLLEESVALRFRSDVPVGVNLSGGLDSSTLLGLIHAVQGKESQVDAFTFATGDPNYDELPWVDQMLEQTQHAHHVCTLTAEETPALAARIHAAQDEPFGGLPTLAYAKVFEQAQQLGIPVLLDGQGLDEQWAGYDYYAAIAVESTVTGPIQGSRSRAVRPECLAPDFRALAIPLVAPAPFTDPLRNRQFRDARYAKLPRALRFNDRISMHHSIELREPFLDHRLFELALSQPNDRKIRGGVHKWLLRQIVADLLPGGVVEAPKRPVQTPQREWLRGPLRAWAEAMLDSALSGCAGAWLERDLVMAEWRSFVAGESDNSFFVWQWISLAMAAGENR